MTLWFQIRSAFQMAFNTLTNAKIITSLGPHKSILGTIIRPDPVLLKRKGGRSGEVTFESLLPGAGEPLAPSYGDGQDIFCNWQWDDEEEPLPRGGSIAEPTSSGKRKRKSSTSKKSDKRARMDANGEVLKHRGNGVKEKTSAKKKQKNQANGSIRHRRAGSSSKSY